MEKNRKGFAPFPRAKTDFTTIFIRFARRLVSFEDSLVEDVVAFAVCHCVIAFKG